MRIELQAPASRAGTTLRESADRHARMILGRYASRVTRVRLRLEGEAGAGLRCTLRLRFDGHDLEVAASDGGAGEEQALLRVLRRALRAVERIESGAASPPTPRRTVALGRTRHRGGSR